MDAADELNDLALEASELSREAVQAVANQDAHAILDVIDDMDDLIPRMEQGELQYYELTESCRREIR